MGFIGVYPFRLKPSEAMNTFEFVEENTSPLGGLSMDWFDRTFYHRGHNHVPFLS